MAKIEIPDIPARLALLRKAASRRRLDAILVCTSATIRALTGIVCDNAVLLVGAKTVFYTDFRYASMVHRVAPKLLCRDLKRIRIEGLRLGYEKAISVDLFERLKSKAPRKAVWVDVTKDLARLRAVKTPDEIVRIRAAERLTCEIFDEASATFRAGMTEREMSRKIRHLMIEKGEGEAFETIVCIGANAAECHHVPDDTVWNGREPVLVDLGVRKDGVCGDLTRCLAPRKSSLYRKVSELVREAHDAAIAAAKPGLTAAKLDKVARDVIRRGGFGRCFGHSLGHGVGYEIHESPAVSKRDKTVLRPGMTVTIEPGVYLEGNLGVRLEDLILITETGCEVLSRTKEP